MAQCKKCSAIIPDNRKYCNRCMKEIETPFDEDYLDRLLNQGGQPNNDSIPETKVRETSDERLDSLLEANILETNAMATDEENLDNAFDYLISDSDMELSSKSYEKIATNEDGQVEVEQGKSRKEDQEDVDDIDILEQIIDNFAYEEEDKEPKDFSYDSLIDEVLAQDTPVVTDGGNKDSEIQSLLDSDFFENLDSKESVVDDEKEFELYDEESIVATPKEEIKEEIKEDNILGEEINPFEDMASFEDIDISNVFSIEDGGSNNFVSAADIESLLQSSDSDGGEKIVFKNSSDNTTEQKEETPSGNTFKDKFKALFMNKGERVELKKQKDIDFEEEEKKQQLALEKEEKKKLKDELKKAKDAAKEEKKAEKLQKKEEKKLEKANREIEVVVDEGKINKAGASIIVLIGIVLCVGIIFGIDWFTYSNTISRAKRYYKQEQYIEAYSQISSMELKEDDQYLYDELRLISKLQSEYEYYHSAIRVNKREDAIFHLIKGLRKYNTYYNKAKELEVEDIYDDIYGDIIKAFDETFSISENRALEIAELSDNEVVKLIQEYKVVEK